MKFDDLDAKMRIFETAHDHCVLPGMHIVVRLDGRNFTSLTKDVHKFKAPFDERFRDLMLDTTDHLMNCGFRVIYGYTESDEISLLLHGEDNTFGRKTRKLVSVLAGEASGRFSLSLGDLGCFDARVCQLPTVDLVVDYFRWRNEDAHRNALNAHCYWSLRSGGMDGNGASDRLSRLSVAEKNELIFQHGTNFNDLPVWQKRGMGLYWESYDKPAQNPLTGEMGFAIRRRVKRDLELPMKDQYSGFVRALIEKESPA
jgi:tRNA(His) 5'-end guanylyltransferase